MKKCLSGKKCFEESIPKRLIAKIPATFLVSAEGSTSKENLT
jgi:hypothetical protein